MMHGQALLAETQELGEGAAMASPEDAVSVLQMLVRLTAARRVM